MSRPIVTKEQMLSRVAFWKDLKSSRMPLVDAVLPQYEREIFNVIGRGVTEDATMEIAIPDAKDFHISIVRAGPGQGSALHTHQTLEVFVPLTGRWSIQWGDEGEHELEIGPWDVISIPTEIFRGFRNESEADAVMLAVLGGDDPGHVTWSPEILTAVRERGYELGPDGNIRSIQD